MRRFVPLFGLSRRSLNEKKAINFKLHILFVFLSGTQDGVGSR